MESYNLKGFPRTLGEFSGLARPIEEDEILLADKDFLRMLCMRLKEKELRLDLEKAQLEIKLDRLENKVIDFIDGCFSSYDENDNTMFTTEEEVQELKNILTNYEN